MITKITTIEDLKLMFEEILLNKTDKINDIGFESVLSGIAFGCAKLGQKCLVNQAVIEGHIFPDTSYGVYLDNLASIRGISPRFGASGSSTYICLTANEGTTYLKDVHKFISSTGITFSLEENVVIDVNGFAYAKIHSDSQGSKTNVNPVSINRVNPTPQGHISCTNEYQATGGRDIESDDLFRQRIKESINQLSRPTLSYLEQVCMKINPDVLRIMKGGIDSDNRLNIIVVSVNGKNFSQQEFDELLSYSQEYLSLSEILSNSSGYSLKLNNVQWLPLDIEFRVDIDPAYDSDSVRREIQIQMNKLFDYRYWKVGDKVEWEDLLFAAKNAQGVRYVPETHFYPQFDINISKYQLPRIRGFIMRDLEGNVISDNSGVLSDIFYPREKSDSYSSSVLTII
jgi:hypothetical protein